MKKVLLIVMALIFAGAVSADGLTTEQGMWCDLNMTSELGIHTITTSDCSQYVSSGNGVVNVYTDQNVHKGRSAFGGSIGEEGSPLYFMSWDADWDWEVLNDGSDGNITLKATATYQVFDFLQNWECLHNVDGCKQTTQITNNGTDKANPKFMYFFDVNELTKRPIVYGKDGNKQTYEWGRDVLITDNNRLASYSKTINEMDVGFGFQDLIDNNFTWDMAYLGNLNELNFMLPDTNGWMIAVTKGDVFPSGYTVTLDPYLDVNESGKDFFVGNSFFIYLYDQSSGGMPSKITEQYSDQKAPYGQQYWRWRTGSTYYNTISDSTARLWLQEDLNVRVKIVAEGGVLIVSGKADLNYTKTSTHYAIDEGLKVYNQTIYDDNGTTNNYNIVVHYPLGNSTAQTKVQSTSDNMDGSPDYGVEWWHGIRRTNTPDTYDYNSLRITCYADAGMFGNSWTATNAYMNDDGRTGWYDSSFDPDFDPNESKFITYMSFYTKEDKVGICPSCYEDNGGTAWIEDFPDALCLDYREPDDLYMTTGTFQGFDYNVGAYIMTAVDNGVDFNIDTVSVGLGDVNRYYPSFEIANYTASTKPVLKYNEVEQTEGVDFISDVNTYSQITIIQWLDEILHTVGDGNAQFKIDDSFVAADVCDYSGTGDWEINDGSTCTCKNETIELSAGSLIISDGSFSMNNCRVLLDAGENVQVGDWNGMWRDFNSVFEWN